MTDFKRPTTVYAIAIDLGADDLPTQSSSPDDDPDQGLHRVLAGHQFERRHGLYVGGPIVTSVQAVLAVIDLTERVPSFATVVRDIRLLRIEEDADLMPVVRRLAG